MRWVNLINGGFTRIDNYGQGVPPDAKGRWFSEQIGPAMVLIIVCPQEDSELWVGTFPTDWYDKVTANIAPWCPQGQSTSASGLVARTVLMMRDMADLLTGVSG